MKPLIPILMTLLCVSLAVADDAPTLLQPPSESQQVDLEQAFGSPAGDSRDDQWHADVEEALRYLYLRQNDVLERLEKLEKACIKVETLAGDQVQRTVPVRAGTGYFSLAPGETLTGYQDPITGRWVSVNQPTSTVTNSQQQPVRVYSSPTVQVRTYQQPRSTYTRGRVRFFSRSRGFSSGSCANGQCSL